MTNYFYGREIGEWLQNRLDGELPAGIVKKIWVGDLSVLPEPKELAERLPIILISPSAVNLSWANEARKIGFMEYEYFVYCLTPYKFRGENSVTDGAALTEAAANALCTEFDLGGFEIGQTDGEAGGLIICSAVKRIEWENAENELFRALTVPINIGKITINVQFRTYASEPSE